MSQSHGKDAIIFSGEFPGIFSLFIQQGTDIALSAPALSEDEISYTDLSDLENLIMKTISSLDTMVFEVKEKFLISHMLTTKLALDTLNGSEYIHEAESLD